MAEVPKCAFSAALSESVPVGFVFPEDVPDTEGSAEEELAAPEEALLEDPVLDSEEDGEVALDSGADVVTDTLDEGTSVDEDPPVIEEPVMGIGSEMVGIVRELASVADADSDAWRVRAGEVALELTAPPWIVNSGLVLPESPKTMRS
jgi:hypothetical protein